jgi:hypothetical protein
VLFVLFFHYFSISPKLSSPSSPVANLPNLEGLGFPALATTRPTLRAMLKLLQERMFK